MIFAIHSATFLIAVLGVTIILPLLALIHVLKNEFKGNDKLIWVLVILLLPILGAFLYFNMGMKQKLSKKNIFNNQ
ncbi:PLDc N-terminal domain-containing protein [Mesonia sp. K7]|uniref:PLDc N-terminal domain-containing protein n=1 Tax=Mesonia sp. K7 TaxID=2218606 RepID=UPI000DA877B7|nr:PLDc N-terminal domain-containing protein [Mesonia sp. K7]PZD77632.1 hypothetical protein DNG35_08620 [Mesonia sp. K7]